MVMQQVRITLSLSTGKELGRKVISEQEVDSDAYADKLIRALLGTSPQEAVKLIEDHYSNNASHLKQEGQAS